MVNYTNYGVEKSKKSYVKYIFETHFSYIIYSENFIGWKFIKDDILLDSEWNDKCIDFKMMYVFFNF